MVHCKKKKYCIFIPFNITSRDEHFTLPVSPSHPGHSGQWCLAQINGALQSRGYNSNFPVSFLIITVIIKCHPPPEWIPAITFSFTKCHWILSFLQVLTSLKSLRLRKLLDESTLAYWVLLGPSWPHWALLILTGPYLVLPGLTWPYLAILILT